MTVTLAVVSKLAPRHMAATHLALLQPTSLTGFGDPLAIPWARQRFRVRRIATNHVGDEKSTEQRLQSSTEVSDARNIAILGCA